MARELVAHFRDGLERDESAADLIARFGEPKAAGKRMGKAARGGHGTGSGTRRNALARER